MSHILLATLGTTPQVLTEAFYYHHRHLGITFDEVHVVTTTKGAEVLRQSVMGPKGVFARLCRDLGVARRAVTFGPSTVHVLVGAGGAPIEDVRTTADGDAVAEQVLALMRHVCRDPQSTVHAIVSGGRKMMGIYLHAMMQLVGRPQDTLFHILVHPTLEEQIVRRRRLDFFYPTGPMRIGSHTIAEGDLLAYIEIPLLCLSPRESPKQDLPYADLVRERQRELNLLLTQPVITIDPRRRQLVVDGKVVTLTPDEFFSSATWNGRGRSGSAGRGVARRTSTSSLPRWAPRRPPVSSSR